MYLFTKRVNSTTFPFNIELDSLKSIRIVCLSRAAVNTSALNNVDKTEQNLETEILIVASCQKPPSFKPA